MIDRAAVGRVLSGRNQSNGERRPVHGLLLYGTSRADRRCPSHGRRHVVREESTRRSERSSGKSSDDPTPSGGDG